MALVRALVAMLIVLGVAHNVRVNSIIEVFVISQNSVGEMELLIKLIPGSNEEKISNIIKT